MSKRISEIHRKLEDMGIRHANLGYTYLVKAIEIVLDNPDSSYNISEIYDIIAEQYGRSSYSVERAIRYSILSTGLKSKEFVMKVADNISCLDLPDVRVKNFNHKANNNFHTYN